MSKIISPPTTLSHYRIVSQIGAGGMGEVYLAQDTKLDRKVALKILPAELAANRDRMERFVREAKSAAALNHPNIATIHEIGESNGTHFIAMEYIDGVTLREKIHQERTELRKLLHHLQHVAEGLAKAHAAGIVHRDLKPENIMITPDGHSKILDFGLAKLIEPRLAETLKDENSEEAATAILQQQSTPGIIMGTVGYMSPEQAQGKTNEIDQRSDIFSFGCILFEAVTGKKPFAADSIVKSLYSLIYEPAPQIRDLNPSAPPDLQRIIRRCLAKDKEERYQTIKDLAIELKELRRELEASAGSDTTVSPLFSSKGANNIDAGPSVELTAARSASVPSPVSSAEYVTQEVKRHKLGIAIALITLIAAVAPFAYYWRMGKGDVAIHSIAVLPFQNKSSDADTEYLSDGLAESLIYRLSQLPNLKVSPANSVFRYKGRESDVKTIASELGVNAVMVGRMSQRGDDLSISVELIDAANNKLLWGEQYDRKSSDLLTTQREIAAAIVQKLQLKFSGSETKGLTKTYTESNEAYHLYLKGRYYWNKRNAENLRKAIEQFSGAAEKDPNFALAYVGLADCYVLLPFYENAAISQDVLPKAKAYAARALEIDPYLGEAHASLAYTQYMLWNWTEAEPEFKRAIELSPNYATAHKWYGNYLEDMRRREESLEEFKKAQELDPLSLIITENLADRFLQSGDLKSAYAESIKVIDLDPSYAGAQRTLSLVYLKQGRKNEALVAAQKAVELSARTSIYLSNLGYIYTQIGSQNEALNVVKELEAKYSRGEANGHHVAAVFVGLGDKDTAFSWLEKDFRNRASTLIAWMDFTPFESLRDDSRMVDLRQRMGLPQ